MTTESGGGGVWCAFLLIAAGPAGCSVHSSRRVALLDSVGRFACVHDDVELHGKRFLASPGLIGRVIYSRRFGVTKFVGGARSVGPRLELDGDRNYGGWKFVSILDDGNTGNRGNRDVFVCRFLSCSPILERALQPTPVGRSPVRSRRGSEAGLRGFEPIRFARQGPGYVRCRLAS